LLALTLLLVLAVGIVLGVRAVTGALAADDEILPRLVSPTPIAHESLDDAPTGPPTEEELANPVDCRPSAIGLTIGLASTTVAAGATTPVPVTVTNTGQVPCLVDVGAQLVLTIYSGDDLVWTSQHCAAGGARRILLDIGGEDVTSVRWAGTRSAEGCPADQPVAAPGSYRAVVTLVSAGDAPETLATVEQAFTVT
jgi:hypothetical protein